MSLLAITGWYVLRCIHFSLGFILFAVIYYLGMFTSSAIRQMDKNQRQQIVPKILPAYFHWLKWEAIWTILSGFALLAWKFLVLKHPFLLFTKYFFFLFLGMSLTITITLMIWIKILPYQNRILQLTQQGKWTKELDLLVWQTRQFSRTCSHLGILVVITMVSSNFFPL